MNKEKCTCNEEEIEPHGCPYSEEINDDYESQCKCCDFCQTQCAYEI